MLRVPFVGQTWIKRQRSLALYLNTREPLSRSVCAAGEDAQYVQKWIPHIHAARRGPASNSAGVENPTHAQQLAPSTLEFQQHLIQSCTTPEERQLIVTPEIERKPLSIYALESTPAQDLKSNPIIKMAQDLKSVSAVRLRSVPARSLARYLARARLQLRWQLKVTKTGSSNSSQNQRCQQTSGKQNQQPERRRILVAPSTFPPAAISDDHIYILLQDLSNAQSLTKLWDCFQALRKSRIPADRLPLEHLHRLARFLARVRPRGPKVQMRLLAVIDAVREAGGAVYLWEWNLLIDCIGKGSRKTRASDFQEAIKIFEELAAASEVAPHLIPDIVTYTTLINIAMRTRLSSLVRQAVNILHKSELVPTRRTHLVMLQHAARYRISEILNHLRAQNSDFTLHEMNSCMWAFGRRGHLNLAADIYASLRFNIINKTASQKQNDADVVRRLEKENIFVPRYLIPDHISYTIMIQSFAHHGDLASAIKILIDMLTAETICGGALPEENANFVPRMQMPIHGTMLPVFRAIFLGFTKHAPIISGARCTLSISHSDRLPHQLSLLHSHSKSLWTLRNLQLLFDNFMALPDSVRPSDRTIYWIMVAFNRTSGENRWIMKKVWVRLERKFGPYTGGRLGKLRRELFGPRSP